MTRSEADFEAELLTVPGLGDRGNAFHAWAVSAFDFEVHEHELLLQVCRLLDRLDELEADIAERGPMVDTRFGERRPNPAVAEERQLSLALGRLLAQLDIPGPDGGEPLMSPASARASKAARSRWDAVAARTGRGRR
jgi:hypothetical protein